MKGTLILGANTKLMPVDQERYQQIVKELGETKTRLVAVSKTKPVEEIKALYDLGQRDFGENYVQELLEKAGQLPKDIRWHFIGHLQSNKVKFIIPFIHLIQVVDSMRLLQEINKQALKNNRSVDCLLQAHIAREETKFGLDENELNEVISEFANAEMKNVKITGLMGMASFTDNRDTVRKEFHYLKTVFDKYAAFTVPGSHARTLRTGMSPYSEIGVEEECIMYIIGLLLLESRI